jgi:hypothetical protein
MALKKGFLTLALIYSRTHTGVGSPLYQLSNNYIKSHVAKYFGLDCTTADDLFKHDKMIMQLSVCNIECLLKIDNMELDENYDSGKVWSETDIKNILSKCTQKYV